MKFCHITPVDHLDLVKGREAHLTLAHIVSGMEGTPEQQKKYCAFYAQEKLSNDNYIPSANINRIQMQYRNKI